MNISDLRLGTTVAVTGEVHTLSMLDGNDKPIPKGFVDVTLRVRLDGQSSGVSTTGDET